MPRKKKPVIDPEVILSAIPEPPEGYRHEVTTHSTTTWKVTLHHPPVYSYKSDPVMTVWGFVKKNGNIHRPKDFTKPSPVVIGNILDNGGLNPYTSIVPTKTVLSDD